MQAFEATESGRKGKDAKGQFGYGSVLEEGKTEQPAQENGWKRHKLKCGLGIVALALVATAVALLALFNRHNEETMEEQFARYRVKFKREYTDEATLRERFAAFKENVQEIRERNAESGSATFGWNQFTDMTKAEFLSTFTGKFVPEATSSPKMKSATLRSSPTVTSLNWHDKGVVPPVRDQGYCGSCWAYSTVATIETAYIMANGLSGSDVEDFELSVQQMVSCDVNGWNGGCNGGDPPGAFDWVADNGGLATEADYPYSDSTYNGNTGSCTNGVGVLDGTSVKSYAYATPECTSRQCNSQDEETMAASVEDYGPITVCVNANYWQSYTGGVMSSNQCGNSGYYALNHCVQLTGFDLNEDNETGKKYWILRNSWATDWGEDGLMRVEYGDNTCGVADEALMVTELE